MPKRDVGMAGSSGYDSEFYTRNFEGNVVPNKRTMRLQGMDPKRQIADSQKQERRVQGRAEAGLPMTDRDKARMKAVGGDAKSWVDLVQRLMMKQIFKILFVSETKICVKKLLTETWLRKTKLLTKKGNLLRNNSLVITHSNGLHH